MKPHSKHRLVQKVQSKLLMKRHLRHKERIYKIYKINLNKIQIMLKARCLVKLLKNFKRTWFKTSAESMPWRMVLPLKMTMMPLIVNKKNMLIIKLLLLIYNIFPRLNSMKWKVSFIQLVLENKSTIKRLHIRHFQLLSATKYM